jgi:hypothetical protein
LPQFLTIEFSQLYKIRRVGVYFHGENVQNPKVIELWLGPTPDSIVLAKKAELEHRAGEHLFDLEELVPAQYLKTRVIENFGGSGVMISKILAFAAPE